MTDILTETDRLARVEETLERMAPIIEALGLVLLRRRDVIDRAGLNKNTLNDKPRFEEVGKRKTYIELGEIATVRKRKSTRKRNQSPG